MSARIGLNVRQRKLASELRRLRELALLTSEQVAQRLGWSASKISRIENARIKLRPEDVQQLLDLYEVPVDQREELLELAGEPDRKRWWDAYSDTLSAEMLSLISLEDTAVAARNFEPMLIPGLLQTEAYAREVFGMWKVLSRLPPIQLERRLEARVTRQLILLKERPLTLHVIVDEAVLSRQIGNASVMRDQLRHLAETSRAPNITVQVLPLAQEREVMAIEPFVLLEIPDFRPVLCVENLFDSRLHIDDADHVHMYSLMFDGVRDAARPPEESRILIERTAKDLWGA